MNADIANTLATLTGRSLLLTQDWSKPELEALLAVATRFYELDRVGVRVPLCPHELAYAIFFDNSTRTKSAWAGAAARLGMQPVIVDGSSTQVAHGETAEETGAMLGMNAHALGVRHDLILGEGNSFMRDMLRGIGDYLVATDDQRVVPMVNLQCDIDHPTQTLATLLSRQGAEIVLAHPEGYELLPETMQAAEANAAEHGGSFRITNDMDEAFEGAVAVYPKSWGPYELMMERVAANRAGDKALMGDIEQRCLANNANHRDWICDERRMGLTKDGSALYMHCLPADIGDEVTHGVMDLHRVNVAREAQWKVYVIMAMLAVAKVQGLGQKLESLG
jgi:ornithine carbamoyltransferase